VAAAGSANTWIPLGDAAEGLVVEGRIVAVVYSENVGLVNEDDPERGYAYELWWVPVEEPEARDVLFGVGDKAQEAWATRWDRARHAGEWLYAEWVEAR
jgi:hypothetical protein